jgi:hypothetical protein
LEDYVSIAKPERIRLGIWEEIVGEFVELEEDEIEARIRLLIH